MAAKKKTATRKKTVTAVKSKSKTASSTKRKAGASAAVKKMATSKGSAAKAAPLKKTGPIKVGRKAFTKSEFVSTIVDQTGVARKEVSAVLETVSKIIGAHIAKQGPETFAWPGLFKIIIVNKPATKARKGTNPFTGEEMMFKAKPASRRVKIRALKQLKAMAS
jgi:nucleoid DNA-binding protein